MKKKIMKGLAGLLVGVMFITGVTAQGLAGFSFSEPAGFLGANRPSDLAHIQKFLERKMVRERLHQLGFTPDEIQGKLVRLDDQQIHQLALNIDTVKVGGEVVGIGVLVLLALVLVISAIAYFSGME